MHVFRSTRQSEEIFATVSNAKTICAKLEGQILPLLFASVWYKTADITIKIQVYLRSYFIIIINKSQKDYSEVSEIQQQVFQKDLLKHAKPLL